MERSEYDIYGLHVFQQNVKENLGEAFGDGIQKGTARSSVITRSETNLESVQQSLTRGDPAI